MVAKAVMAARAETAGRAATATAATEATAAKASTQQRRQCRRGIKGARESTVATVATAAIMAKSNGKEGRDGREGRNVSCQDENKIMCHRGTILYVLPQCPHVHGTDWYVGYYNPHTYQHYPNKNIVSVFAFSVKALTITFIRNEKCNQLPCTFLCTNY